ncbi:MAG: HepT-like ribonuclease domain-containing protein [Tepidisphaeraceae bacterium]|jgi:uncharacterized protein with HEPN domain
MSHETQISPEDHRRLEHMRKAASDAIRVLGKRDASQLDSDMVRSRALVNCFTEIGEAAARVTQAGRRQAAAIPWTEIIGMRNIVVHVYWGIDLSELVKTVRNDLPKLLSVLDGLLKKRSS